MQFISQTRLMALAAMIALGGGLSVAQGASATEVAREKANAVRSSNESLQKLIERVSSQREKMIADHEALAKQLKDATEGKRKEILSQMQEQKRSFEAAQSALHKQIRDEQRRMRQSAVSGNR